MKMIVIRSVMFDTTVYGGTVNKNELIKNHSFTVIKLAEQSIISNYSTPAIKKELLETPVEKIKDDLMGIYAKIVEIEFPLSDEISKLGALYQKSENMPYDDALIIAASSINHIDAILSWNKRHLVNEQVQKAVKRINDQKGFKTPLVITPEELITKGSYTPNSRGILYALE